MRERSACFKPLHIVFVFLNKRFTIGMQIIFVSLIIHGFTLFEFCLCSAVSTNAVENCISEYPNCSSVGDKVICYRLCSNNRLSWNDAQKLCAKHDFTLPVIRNKKEQESLESYLKSQKVISGGAWTSGEKVSHSQWTWLNGQPSGVSVVWEKGSQYTNSDYKTHAALTRDQEFKKENPLHSLWYMCQYRGNACASKESLNLKDSCVVLSAKDTSFYAARNVCLDGGGDLAVLSDEDLNILKNHSRVFINPNYWIGLGQISWQWKFLNDKPEEVKYSKWSRNAFPLDSELCISIQATNGEWRASKCDSYSDIYSVICQNERNISPSTTPISPTSTLGPVAQSSSIHNPTGSTDVMTTSEQTVVYALIGLGVLLILICTICIFLLVRRRLKRVKEIRSSKANTMQLNNESDPDEKPTKKPPETTTASEDEVRGVYAEISPPKNSNRDLENAPSNNPHQPSGTVYASLEFKKEAIYAEPIKKSNIVNAPS